MGPIGPLPLSRVQSAGALAAEASKASMGPMRRMSGASANRARGYRAPRVMPRNKNGPERTRGR